MSENNEWLFESVIGFLRSPMWTIPIQHFMEQNCFVFSPTEIDDEAEEEDVKEYKDIHTKYKELVDCLLKTFLKDIGTNNEQFITACNQTNRFTAHPAYMELFEQVWSADNFELFKSQMIRKNIELELQALLLLQCQLGFLNSLADNDDDIMAIVIQRSKDEFEGRNANVSKYDLEIAKNIVSSKETLKSIKKDFHDQENINKQLVEMSLNDELTPDKEPVKTNEYFTHNDKKFDAKFSESKKLPELTNQRLSSASKSRQLLNKNENSQASALQDDTNKNSETVFNIAQTYVAKSNGNLDANELERRADFMRKQREILIERKKIEREKQLDKFVKESERHDQLRPGSSRAARAVLDGVETSKIDKSLHKQASVIKPSAEEEKERKKLEARRALADTLKKEVINNSNKK